MKDQFKNSDILYMLAQANRECGYDKVADVYFKAARKFRREEADNELVVMEAEIIVNKQGE